MSTVESAQVDITSSHTLAKIKFWEFPVAKKALVVILALVTLIPIVRMFMIVATTGADTISNDYINYVELIDKVVNGTYDWRNYFHDTFMAGAHSMAIPVLIRILIVQLTQWSIYPELYVTFMLFIAKLLLFCGAFFYSKRISNWLLGLALSALIFSTSQINIFTFGDVGLQLGLNQFGLALGIWSLVRFPKQWRGIILMAIGGLIASWSGGGGPLVWPTFLIGMILLHFRKITHYGVWLFSAVLASLPYLIYMILRPVSRPTSSGFTFDYHQVINAIGWPFAQSFSLAAATLAGLIGIVLLLSGAIMMWHYRNTLLKQSVAVIMTLVYGLLNLGLITVFRGASGLAPWYTTHFMLTWIGLTGMAYILWHSQGPKTMLPMRLRDKLLKSAGPIWSTSLAIILTLLYLRSNITYTDKVMYLYSRAPVSASCLRHYRISPTYCDKYLFQWGVGWPDNMPDLAQPLEKDHLSVFASQQRWTLQGDFVFDTTRLHQAANIPAIFWSGDLTPNPIPWWHYKHLNLFLHAPNSIEWKITLPDNTTQADFHSAIALSPLAPADINADGVTFEIALEQPGQAHKILFSKHLPAGQNNWSPVDVPLTTYAGQTITLRLASKEGNNPVADWAMYQYPYIDVTVNPNLFDSTKASGQRFVPTITNNDFHFDITKPQLWQSNDLQSLPAQSTVAPSWIIGADPVFQYNQPLNICLADYTHIYVRMASSQKVVPRAMQIFYRLNDQSSFDDFHSIEIPLLPDEAMHSYSYDLKLLELKPDIRLTGIRLDPIEKVMTPDKDWIQIEDFRLIRGAEPSVCPPTARQ